MIKMVKQIFAEIRKAVSPKKKTIKRKTIKRKKSKSMISSIGYRGEE